MSSRKELRIVDLFAGIGGLRQGVQQAASEHNLKSRVVFTSEIKKPALATLEANWPDEHIHGDITKVDEKDIPSHDMLLAGFPCQPFSFAGSRKGFADTRGTLFFDVLRILAHHKPTYFILENVEGLVHHDKDPEAKNPAMGRTLTTILHELKTLGYNVDWSILNATDFGVPQARKRIFIAGHLDKTIDFADIQKQPTKVFKDIMENNASIVLTEAERKFQNKIFAHFAPAQLVGKKILNKRGGSKNIHSWDFAYNGAVSDEQKELLNAFIYERRRKFWALKKNVPAKDGVYLSISDISTFYTSPDVKTMLDDLVSKGYMRTNALGEYDIAGGRLSFPYAVILHPEHTTPTVVATDANRLAVVDGDKLRRLTWMEFKRLFGFPDDYIIPSTLKDSSIFDVFGNSVVVPVSKAVASLLFDAK